jgi:hypothetical protein
MPGRGQLVGTRPHEGSGTPASAPDSPVARRRTGSRWRDPRLLVGLVVVAACALLGGRLFAAADDTVGVWVTERAMNQGEDLAAGDLVRREVRFADQAAADRYLSADASPPADSTLSRPLGAGELVPRGALGSGADTGLTEVPLSVGTEAVPGTVRVGSLVDVWVTPEAVADADVDPDSPKAPTSTLVFDDVAVVSAPASGTSLGPSATRQVIVGVAPEGQDGLPTALAALSGGAVILTVQR